MFRIGKSIIPSSVVTLHSYSSRWKNLGCKVGNFVTIRKLIARIWCSPVILLSSVVNIPIYAVLSGNQRIISSLPVVSLLLLKMEIINYTHIKWRIEKLSLLSWDIQLIHSSCSSWISLIAFINWSWYWYYLYISRQEGCVWTFLRQQLPDWSYITISYGNVDQI